MFFWRRVAPQVPEEGLRPTATPGYTRNFRDLNRLVSEGKSFSGYERNPLFWNLGGGRFAEVGGLLGVDFDDDARAVAAVDWDRDGDLDLWVTNRTVPRVRLLRNNLPRAGSFVSVRLAGDGERTNRDAIGARVALWRSAEPQERQVRTLHGGDGFLSQSSPAVHFGVGEGGGDFVLSVAWPGGGKDIFTGLGAGMRYTVRQGEGLVEEAPVEVAMASEGAVGGGGGEAVPGANGVWLANRVPFPDLAYGDESGDERTTAGLLGKPALVSLWATWCAPCLKELGEIGKHGEAIRERGVTVLALNVDGLSVGGEKGVSGEPGEVLERVGYGFAHGVAGEEALGKLEILVEFLTSRRTPLALPASFLIDREGNVAAYYREALGWERLAGDLALLDAPAERQLGRVSPRGGRWSADPREIDLAAYLSDYATQFAAGGFAEESRRLYGIATPRGESKRAPEYYNLAKAAAQQGLVEEAEGHYRAAIRLDPNYGQAYSGLGALLLMQKRADEAEALFERALEIDPNHATALINLATIDQSRGDLSRALVRLQAVVSRNPGYGEAQFNLGSLLASMKRHDEAIEHLSKAVELMPERAVAHFNLASVYSASGQWERAEAGYRAVLELDPGMGVAHYGLGVLQGRQGRHGEAVFALRKAISLGGASPVAYTKLGESLLAQGEGRAAVEALEKALELDPEYAAAKRVLGEIGGAGRK